MKLENVLVDECGICKVHDFGTSLVKIMTKAGEKTEIDSAGGNQYYAAPEVLDNWHPGRKTRRLAPISFY